MHSLRISESAPEPRPSTVSATALGLVYALVVVAFLPLGLDQFLLPKVLVVLVGVPAVAALVLLRPGSGSGADAVDGRPDRAPLLLLAAFVLWAGAMPLAGAANRTLHAIGSLEVLLWGGLLVTAAVIRRRTGAAGAWRLLALVAGPAGVVAVLAILQGSGADPVAELLGLTSTRPGRWRLLTTLGNPGWTAELLAASLPVVLVVLARLQRSRWSPAAVGACLLVTVAVARTGSRTGLVLIGVGVGSLALLCPSGGRRRMRAALAAAAVVVAGATISVAAGSARFAELPPLTGRLGLWNAGLQLVSARPVAGWGLRHTTLVLPEGLKAVVARVDPGLEAWLPTTLVDRLDQDWLQTAVEGGAPAALLLLAIWFGALTASVRRSRGKGGTADAAIAAALLVLGVGSLVSSPLHTPATAVLFWILCGLAAGAGPTRRARTGGLLAARRGRRVLAGLTLVATGAALLAAVAAGRADLEAGRGRRLLARGRPEVAAPLLARAAATAPWLDPVWPELAAARAASSGPAETLAVTVAGARWTASERLWASQARALADLGHPEAAATVLARGLAVLPASPVLLAARHELEGDG